MEEGAKHASRSLKAKLVGNRTAVNLYQRACSVQDMDSYGQIMHWELTGCAVVQLTEGKDLQSLLRSKE